MSSRGDSRRAAPRWLRGRGAQGRGSGHRAQAPVTTALSHTLCGVGSVGFGSRTGRADDRVLPGPLPR